MAGLIVLCIVYPTLCIFTIMNVLRLQPVLAAGIFLVLLLTACEQEELLKDPAARLAFSRDTISFDTIFTSIGSTTRQLKVFNRYRKTIRISEIRLAGGESSPFRLNIDGVSGFRQNNLEILPNDSMYIFIQVTIDPKNNNSPVLVHDSILFTTNGTVQDVDLVAWGQDMHLILADTVHKSTVWTADKPYLIRYYLIVDSAQTLTVEQGTKIYMHRNAVLEVRGSLHTQGTFDQPVSIAGDRLEEDYSDIPGQWLALAFSPSSTDNLLEYTEIRNGVVLQIGRLEDPRSVPVTFRNCRILNMSFAGIYAFGASISAENTIVADAGTLLLGLFRGGTYHFYHCTLVNKGVIFYNRSAPSVILSNYFTDQNNTEYAGDMKEATFGNCIVWGNYENELAVAFKTSSGAANYRFKNSIIRLDPSRLPVTDTSHFDSVWYNTAPAFRDADHWNFIPDSASFSNDKGSLSIASRVPFDFRGKNRLADGKPDPGAFEWISGDTTRRKSSHR